MLEAKPKTNLWFVRVLLKMLKKAKSGATSLRDVSPGIDTLLLSMLKSKNLL